MRGERRVCADGTAQDEEGGEEEQGAAFGWCWHRGRTIGGEDAASVIEIFWAEQNLAEAARGGPIGYCDVRSLVATSPTIWRLWAETLSKVSWGVWCQG